MTRTLSRRKLLATTGAAAGAVTLRGFPHVAAATKITIGVLDSFVEPMTTVLTQLQFTQKTGIEVEVGTRARTADDFTTQMAGAIQSGKTPFDVIDFEDEVASVFPQAGWMLPLNDLMTPEVQADFPQSMIDMAAVWDTLDGEQFRIHHNYEAQYYWYRKDVFDAKGIAVPKTWEDVRGLGAVLTDEAEGVYASGDGLMKGAFLNVFLDYLTLQAGGDPYQVDDKYQTALQYLYDLLHKDKVFTPGSLQKEYDAINQEYVNDRIFCMRQWPYFYDVARQATPWYQEGKAEIALPPQGPGGAANSTYAAGWGWGIPKTTANKDAAIELVKFLIDPANVGAMAKINTWYLCPRASVLAAAGEQGIAPYLKQYTDAGVIGTRPYHPKFRQAVAVFEDAASAFLTDQISIEDALKQTKDGLAKL
ncbi:MAG TPA: extracellular solute-binding protein [Thermomicrobiales bacterium]|nr:extracellular solute-binding protein [Thermomicrobiales bacterium]